MSLIKVRRGWSKTKSTWAMMGLLRQPTIARLTNYISFSQALSMMFHDSATNFYPGRCNSRCCWAAESAWKKSPALTMADQGDLMHEGSSTRFTRFSVFDLGFVETKTWEVFIPKRTCSDSLEASNIREPLQIPNKHGGILRNDILGCWGPFFCCHPR